MRLFLTFRNVLILLLAVAITVGAGVYLERKTIARRFADAELAARRVDALYEIRSIGPRVQRIEHVVLGDPRNPDLTAEWAEIEFGLGLSGVGVRSVRAGGVRLRGRFANGKASFGVVDRLLPETKGGPFALPDMDLALDDARLVLATDYGEVRARLDGSGNLASGFAGTLVADMTRAQAGEAVAEGLAARFRLGTERRRIRLSGPVTANRLSFAGNRLDRVSAALNGSASESLADASAAWSLKADAGALRFGAARHLHAQGRIVHDGASQHVTARFDLEGAKPAPAERTRLMAALPVAAGTPVAPLLDQLRSAVAHLDRGSTISAPLEYHAAASERTLLVGPPTIVSGSGAQLVGSGRGLVVPLDRGQAGFDGEFALSGGGFPAGTVRLALVRGRWEANARFRPYRAGGAALALAPVELSYGAPGLGVRTAALIDGPLGGGRIMRLNIPVRVRPGQNWQSGCYAPSFRAIEIQSFRLDPATINICLSRNEARVAPATLSGSMGASPVRIAAQGARFGLQAGDFVAKGLSLRLGPADAASHLELAELAGRFGRVGAEGRYAGGSGAIANVPLRASEGEGAWQFSGGALVLNGGLRLADGVATDPRFNPLVTRDFSLRLADNRVIVSATAREPKTQMPVADIRIRHDLEPGVGNAIIDVAGLTFGRALQPEMLTTTTLGVIANVVGTVAGKGEIRWTPKGVTSSGIFRTESLDMAAAFGPVTGLKGEIALSDLLGLETGPGQQVRIGSINPGIAVIDGVVDYRLLPGLRLQIEGGRWPFAGGSLILEPTVIDLSQTAERRLTFRVEGLDAGQFVNQLQFDNIDATGIYDGVLPMIFDAQGGRIEGGRLVARGGGTLAYVGEISNQNLGTMGRVAFDALKSIRYHRLSIDLDGPLDGDVVTRVRFAGVNQAPIEGVRAKLPIPVRVTGLTNFPFVFNVTITAPFRKLFDMSRTISDPSLLIERLNPDLQRIGPAKPIQRPESEPMR